MSFLNDFPDARLYYTMARDFVRDATLWDDCVQEAIIAVWQVKMKYPGKPQAYYNAVARKRIRRVGSSQLFLDAPVKECGRWMPRKNENCARRESHLGDCACRSTLHKTDGSTPRRTNASHDVLRQPHDSYDQIFHRWGQDD